MLCEATIALTIIERTLQHALRHGYRTKGTRTARKLPVVNSDAHVFNSGTGDVVCEDVEHVSNWAVTR